MGALVGKVNEQVVELVPVPLPVHDLRVHPPVHVGEVPEGAVTVHVTFPLGLGSLALAGVAPTVAVNDSVEPGWAGDGEELVVKVVDELAAATLVHARPAAVAVVARPVPDRWRSR